jgi:ABC-type branched-subunit amino acid transport system ATPase component
LAGELLNVTDINQFYGGSHILRKLAFEARVGEVTVVLGRNGVGKTTLLKSLMGVVPVKSGSIVLGGQDLTHAPPYERVRKGIGYVPQGREIFGRLTVEDNLRMGLASKPGGTAIPSELFELFPVLKQMIHRRGGDLSGGQQQQLAIARALAEHHQGDRPRDPPAGRAQDDGHRARRAVLRLRRRTRRPVPRHGARRDHPARAGGRHGSRGRAAQDFDLKVPMTISA